MRGSAAALSSAATAAADMLSPAAIIADSRNSAETSASGHRYNSRRNSRASSTSVPESPDASPGSPLVGRRGRTLSVARMERATYGSNGAGELSERRALHAVGCARDAEHSGKRHVTAPSTQLEPDQWQRSLVQGDASQPACGGAQHTHCLLRGRHVHKEQQVHVSLVAARQRKQTGGRNRARRPRSHLVQAAWKLAHAPAAERPSKGARRQPGHHPKQPTEVGGGPNKEHRTQVGGVVNGRATRERTEARRGRAIARPPRQAHPEQLSHLKALHVPRLGLQRSSRSEQGTAAARAA
eukprot:scaffold73160_cov30-Tisochrysis_lutea.AAC.5